MKGIEDSSPFCRAHASNKRRSRKVEVRIRQRSVFRAVVAIDRQSRAVGWCPPDSQLYNEPLAEKAWSRLLAFYDSGLI